MNSPLHLSRRAALFAVMATLAGCGGGGGATAADGPVVGAQPPASDPLPVASAISLTAGAAWGAGSLDGVGRSAYFSSPQGSATLNCIAAAASGTLYVTDTLNFTVRKVTADGTVTTLAGRSRVSGTQDGHGTNALFKSPREIAVTPDGNVFVLDEGRLRRITPQGEVTKVDTAPANIFLDRLAASPDGALFLAGSFDGAIYRLVPGSGAALFAGQPGTVGTIDGPGVAARFSEISDLAVDAFRNVYVSQPRQHTIRRIAPDASVTTFAGAAGQMGSRDGMGAAALLGMPATLAVESQGAVWFMEPASGVFRRISPAGEVTSPFGNAVPMFQGYVTQGGQAAFGGSGDLYFTMPLGVVRISAGGQISSVAGHDFPEGDSIGHVRQLVVNSAGHPVVASLEMSGATSTIRVRKFGAEGELLPLAPTDGLPTDAAGNGYAASVVSRSSGINVTQNAGGFLSRVSPTGETTRLADWPADSTGAMAPAYMTVSANGTLHFIDVITGNLVRWTAGEGIRVLGDVGAAEPNVVLFARNARSLAADESGRVYVLSSTLLQRFGNGVLTTVAGVRGEAGTFDGTGTQARFRASVGPMVADAAGNVYIAEEEVVRKVTPEGVVTTVVGQVGKVGLRTGDLPGSLGLISHMAIAPDGSLHLIADNALVQVSLP